MAPDDRGQLFEVPLNEIDLIGRFADQIDQADCCGSHADQAIAGSRRIGPAGGPALQPDTLMAGNILGLAYRNNSAEDWKTQIQVDPSQDKLAMIVPKP